MGPAQQPFQLLHTEVSMQTTEVFQSGDFQAVRLPKEYEFTVQEVTVRKEGETVILEPVPIESWPEGFFESIVIQDPAFQRPDQGALPPSPVFGISDQP
jgi:virulence-associated protein VagC